MTTLAGEAVELAHLAGLDLDVAQQRVLTGALGQRADGRWSAPEVGLVEPRQNGKGGCVEAVSLTGLYLLAEQIVYTSHLMATSRKMRVRIQNLIESTPDLDREVKRVGQSNEDQSIELRSGAKLDFVARSPGAARGWSADRVFLDEALELDVDEIGSLMPTLIARPNWQLWYLSSAGKKHSAALRKIRQRGVDGDPQLAYYEWSVPEDVYRAAPEYVANMPAAWAQANPAVGTRIAFESIRILQRSMDAEEFAREIMGVWDEEGGSSLIDVTRWGLLADPTSCISGGVLFAVEVSPGLVSAAITVAGYREDGIPHLEITGRDDVLDHRYGTHWVVLRAVELDTRWGPATWVVDPTGPAGALKDDLIEAGLTVEFISGGELGRACGRFVTAVSAPERTGLRHLGQQPVLDAIRAVRKREIGDGPFTFGRKASSQDITPASGFALALHGLAIHGPARYDVLASVR